MDTKTDLEQNKKYVLLNVYLPNVVRCIPYTVIKIFEYNCNDLDLGRFKVIKVKGHGANRNLMGGFLSDLRSVQHV